MPTLPSHPCPPGPGEWTRRRKYHLFPTLGFLASPAARNEPPLGAAGARPQEPTIQGGRAPFPLPGSLATGPRVGPRPRAALGASETPAPHSGVFGRFRVGPRGCPRHSQVWECLSPSSWRTRTILLLLCASPKAPPPRHWDVPSKLQNPLSCVVSFPSSMTQKRFSSLCFPGLRSVSWPVA